MNSFARTGSADGTSRPTTQLTTALNWLLSGLAAMSLVLVVWTLLTAGKLPGKAGWPESVLVLTTLGATLVSLSRQLPGQNVILAAAVIGFIGTAAHALSAATGIPFGPLVFTDNAGPEILGVIPWPIPAIWIIAVLNSRGVARLILRPWRKLRTYGFWLIGVTAGLSVLFAMALDPFASQANRYWLWQPTKFPFTWHGSPLVNYLGWLVAALLILAFATPALISKQPRSKTSRPDNHPLAIWLLALALFAIAGIRHNLWSAVGFCILVGAATTYFAVRGARW